MGEKGNGNGALDDGIEPKQEEGQPRTQERPGTGTPDPKQQPPPKKTEGGARDRSDHIEDVFLEGDDEQEEFDKDLDPDLIRTVEPPKPRPRRR